jgi:hypothetical protein
MFAALSPGDYNADGNVDALDYGLWKSKFGSTTHLAADGNGNGVIDAGDYTIWRDNVTSVAGKGWTSVPEPTTFLGALILVGVAAALRAGRRRTR